MKPSLRILGILLAVLFVLSMVGYSESSDEDDAEADDIGVEAEVGEITNSYEGDDVYFEVDGIFYEGHVTAHVSADEIHVLLDDHSTMVISIEQMGASLIDHP